jgi:iron complex transport system substrate-binding protein
MPSQSHPRLLNRPKGALSRVWRCLLSRAIGPVLQHTGAAGMWALLASAAIAAAGLPGVAGAAQPLQITDDRGKAITLALAPQRIVSLLPSLTETVCALQACERLVGVDQWSDWPEPVRRLPKLGGLEDVALEALVRLKPDVVLVARSQRLIDRLEALGLTVVALDSDRHADVERSVRTLASLLGRADEGQRLWQRIQREVDAAAARIPPALRGQALYVEIGGGGYAAGAGSFIGQTLAQLGLGNVAPADGGPFPRLNAEYVIRRQPYGIITTAREQKTLPQRPGWAALRAVQAGRVCGLAPQPWDALVRPGPRMGEAAQHLADCLAGWGG